MKKSCNEKSSEKKCNYKRQSAKNSYIYKRITNFVMKIAGLHTRIGCHGAKSSCGRKHIMRNKGKHTAHFGVLRVNDKARKRHIEKHKATLTVGGDVIQLICT